MDINAVKTIADGRACLGIELGSTRIKACLIGEELSPIASGSSQWENRLENGYWTYSLDDVQKGLQCAVGELMSDVKKRYGIKLERVAGIGISAMMHGFLAFDENDRLLTPFRTWRNTTTERAADILTSELGFNIPQRWTAAHLYQAVLDEEDYVGEIAHVTTLAGYVHFILTGKRIVGIGEASGIFPVSGNDYDSDKAEKMNALLKCKGFNKDIRELFPSVLLAGKSAGVLTESGAKYLDPTGTLKAGVPLCPPEGDAGTGMTATNSVRASTGNISAGTSIFSMLVLKKPLERVCKEIDVVATPDGKPCAMVHCNNCCSELDAWVNIFGSFAGCVGADADKNTLYEAFYKAAAKGESDCGGITCYNFLSAEPVVKVAKGEPMYFRTSDSRPTFENFARAQIYSAFASLAIGMKLLPDAERQSAEIFNCHGGMFKSTNTAQQLLADALGTPTASLSTAGEEGTNENIGLSSHEANVRTRVCSANSPSIVGEGGAWGMALLAAYMVQSSGKELVDWLDSEVFDGLEIKVLTPDKADSAGFERFLKRYKEGLKIVRS